MEICPGDLAPLEPWRARFMPGPQQRFLQRLRQGFRHHSFTKDRRLLLPVAFFNKKRSGKNRSCFHLGSRKVAKRFQQSSSQTSNITTRHIKQSKKQCKRRPKLPPALVLSKVVQPVSPGSSRAPARFQQGSSAFPGFTSKDPRFHQCSNGLQPARFRQRFQQGFTRF